MLLGNLQKDWTVRELLFFFLQFLTGLLYCCPKRHVFALTNKMRSFSSQNMSHQTSLGLNLSFITQNTNCTYRFCNWKKNPKNITFRTDNNHIIKIIQHRITINQQGLWLVYLKCSHIVLRWQIAPPRHPESCVKKILSLSEVWGKKEEIF